MYLIGNINGNNRPLELVSHSVLDIVGDIINVNGPLCSNTPLSFMQDVCKRYEDYIIESHNYWVLKDRYKEVQMPNVLDVYDGLILMNSIDKAINISDKLGICLTQ